MNDIECFKFENAFLIHQILHYIFISVGSDKDFANVSKRRVSNKGAGKQKLSKNQ